MQQQLGNLETISTFFNSSNQKFEHLHGDTGKPRKSGSLTRQKSNGTSLSNGLRLKKNAF
jgi:hypothetical protein